MEFSFDVVKKALMEAVNEGKNNIVSSPLSIAALLSMMAVGCKGHTLQKMLDLFGSGSIDDIKTSYNNLAAIVANCEDIVAGGRHKGPIINFVNGLWYDQHYTLKSSFQQSLISVFEAETKSVDFANKSQKATEDVNSWVDRATHGLIAKIVDSIDSDTIVFLANALYFKGAWKCPFVVSRTKDRDFYLLNGENVQVPFMSNNSDSHFFGSFESFKVVKLPYERNRNDSRRFSMHLFLPHERQGLKNMMQEFNENPKLFLNQNLDLPEVELDEFLIPKFRFSYTFDAYKIMQEMGLELSIDDLSYMLEYEHANVGGGVGIMQTSKIEVNEEGTEAAAVTFSVLMGCSMYYEPGPSFVADHPFIFVIKEDTSATPLFVGVVLNPLS